MRPREMYIACKEKFPNVMLGCSKCWTFRAKCCELAGSSDIHFVSVCRIHQNAILLVDAINWDFTHKYLISKMVCDANRKECMRH